MYPNFAGHCSKRLKYGDICKFSQKCQGSCCCYPNFTGEETEGYGGGGSRPQAHCQLVAESGFGSKCLASESTALTTVHPACWHEPVQHGQRRSEEVWLPWLPPFSKNVRKQSKGFQSGYDVYPGRAEGWHSAPLKGLFSTTVPLTAFLYVHFPSLFYSVCFKRWIGMITKSPFLCDTLHVFPEG